MTIDDIRLWTPWVLSVGAIVYAWLTRGSKENADKISGIEAQVEVLKTEHVIMKAAIEQMPSKDMVHRLELSISDMNGKITGMAASAEATERTARRVEQFLIDQAKK